MYMNPGDVIAITQIAFKGAYIAVDSAYKAVKFFENSEALVVRLQLEQFRLQIWGTNSGLDDGKLTPALLIVHEILCRELQSISKLFQNANELRDRYSMLALETDDVSEDAPVIFGDSMAKDDDNTKKYLERMRKSLRLSGIRRGESIDADDDGKERRVEPGIWRRVRWGIRDKEHFKTQIDELHERVNLLHQLLSETDRQRSKNDEQKIKIVVVGSAVDAQSLALVRSAVGLVDAQTHSMIERKALSEEADPRGSHLALQQAHNSSGRIKLSDFALPPDYGQTRRLLVRWQQDPSRVALLEKKAYDPDIDPTKKTALARRLQRLTMLLSMSQTKSLGTVKALDYVSDNANFCWWLVLEFPASVTLSLPSPKPLTLERLLQPGSKYKPPLEQRLQLALSICTTMSSLYSSGWLHKSLGSANILFPLIDLPSESAELDFLQKPMISGFEYSRQETEAESINNAMMFSDVAAAIYRHPTYQGEAAQGYHIQLDIYSLGLVLVEIGLWVPLASFLQAANAAGQKRFSSTERFHRPEALILKTMVLDRLKKEFAFRLGTTYYEAVNWCLTFADISLTNADEDPVHPALEFYNNVVAPLQGLKLTG
ncbi:hypothetical protein H2200_013205 [Cladophialophora chaetospira]|uniref:Protein kinase domain-containing protein n=1 Tax=Cladophialophora chaetospira TaxID=386627 RepID=A0AA38WWC3_9EURO|nr:hypothetical protein H2200_013205 [Cladophialophora chaetospira]